MIRRDALFAVSLATLLFLESWSQIQGLPSHSFYNREFVTQGDLLSTLLPSILLAGVAIFALLRAGRNATNPWVRRAGEAILLLILYIPLSQVVVWIAPLQSAWRIVHALGLVLVAVAAATAMSWVRLPAKAASALVMGLSPLLPLLLFHFWAQPHISREASHDRRTAALNSSAPPRRVVLVIFDEWDRYLTLEARPRSIQLPEVDRFREGAIDVERATSPAFSTAYSLPSMLTGRPVKAVEPEGPKRAELTFEDGETEIFGQGPNVFHRVRALGGNTALVGWHLPYCRVLARDLCDCSWEPLDRPMRAFSEDPPRLLPIALEQWRSLFLAVPLARRLLLDKDKEKRLWAQARFTRLMSRALSLVGDARFNLVVLHLPVPHGPGIFDRHTKQLSTSPTSNYIDNLELMDQALGQLRLSMERHGTWDSSLVLLTSDHPFRVEGPFNPYRLAAEESQATGDKMHPYVPFLLKMPGQKEGVICEGPLKTIVMQDMILRFLRGDLRETSDMVTWLRERGERNLTYFRSRARSR